MPGFVTAITCMLLFGSVYAYSADSPAFHDSVDQSFENYYPYDELIGKFQQVPQTREGVDSLLTISAEASNYDPHKSAYAALQALDLAEEIRYGAGTARAYNALGTIYQILGDNDYALQQFEIALDMEMARDDKERVGRILNSIAQIHLNKNNYREAVDNYKDAIEILGETGNDEVKASALMNLGVTFHHLEQYEKSLEYYEEVMKLSSELGDHERIRMQTAAKIGNTYIEMEEYEKAEEYLKRAVEFFEREDYAANQSENYLSLGRLYRNWGKYEEALDYIQRGLRLAESTGQLPYIKDAYHMLTDIFEVGNDDQETLLNALDIYKHYHAAHDSLLDAHQRAQIKQRQILYDLERKNNEITILNNKAALQEATLTQQELWRKFLLTGLSLLAIIAGLLYRQNSVRKHTNNKLHQQAEEIATQNKQLIQLNEEKNEFLGMAAHDLRNPLSAIKGVADLMKEENSKNKETLELIEIIKISTERMLDLIENFLDVNAIEQGLNGHDIIPMDISEPLVRVVESIKNTASKKQISIAVEIAPNIMPVMVDIKSFQRIMENLLSNAIKFSPAGSAVEVSTHMQTAHMDISVRDNGPGITVEDQKRMFKRYGRLSNKPTSDETSTGLGLFIVKKLTETMRGKIKCESKPGAGSVFTVSLPFADNPKPAINELKWPKQPMFQMK